MITLLSIQTVSPGREEEYVAIQQKLARLTFRHEPHIVRYEHYRGTKPGQFFSFLTFPSLIDFLDHQIATYHDDVNWDGLFVEHELQWLDPIPEASPLDPSEIPPLPAGVDAARRAYADMLPAARPLWWGAPLPPVARS